MNDFVNKKIKTIFIFSERLVMNYCKEKSINL